MLVAKQVLLCCLLVLILGTAQFVLGDSDKEDNPSDEKDKKDNPSDEKDKTDNPSDEKIKKGNNGKGAKKKTSSELDPKPQYSEPGPSRVKRGAVDISNEWGDEIPYVYDSSYSSPTHIANLERSFRKISDWVCVKFNNVTNTIDKNDPNWLVKQGYDYNSYLLVQGGSDCSAYLGYTPGANTFNPCFDPQINWHEILHTIGTKHAHQMIIAKNYVVINPDNIKPSMVYTYKTLSDPSYEIAFDGLSRMVYARKTFTLNGMETYTWIRDDCNKGETSYSSELANFIDLNNVLNCTARFCPLPGPNCNYGYYMRYKGVCQCMCPPDYDPATKCATMLNGPNTGASWPRLPIAVVGGGAGISCPLGFTSGYVNITGVYPLLSIPDAPLPVLQTDESVTIYPICTYNGSVNGNNDWNEWPQAGWFCIPKPNIPCGGAFVEYWIKLNSTAPVKSSGKIGDTVINGNFVTLKFCCKNQEYKDIFLDLPNGVPFRFYKAGSGCPQVRGMREYSQLVDIKVIGTVGNGTLAPAYGNLPSEVQLYHCIYLPLTYGCNQDITFNSTYKTVTISTPGFGSTSRPTLKRCIYVFRAPAYSRIVVTFTTCDIDPDDKLMVKKYNRFQEPLRIDCQNTSFQVLSETSYLQVEIQTSYLPASRTGIQFTAKVVLPEDNCFNAATGGDDYALDAAVTETYEDCLYWKDSTSCYTFPTSGMSGNWLLLSDNKCRNMGDLSHPYCYTHQNGSNCIVRFCDPNNLMTVIDSHSDCPTLVQQDPTFCNESLQRRMCMKSCNYIKPSTSRATCLLPSIPSDGTLASTQKSLYKQGERLYVKCTANPSQTPMEMMCTATGWTSLTTACNGTSCVDAISTSLCEKLMTNFPQYCVANKTTTAAVLSCKKSCGACATNAKCNATSSTSYTALNKSVSTGSVMMYTCNANMFLVSGDLNRACSSTGTLLGTEPVCSATPLPTDVNRNAVRRQLNTIPENLAYLINFSYTRVPFTGFVDRLYFYCVDVGNFTLFFGRVNSTGGYTFVGSLVIPCKYINWRWTYKIPAAQQIPVNKGDIPGIHAETSVLSASDCTGAPQTISNCPSMSATSFSQVKSSMNFNKITCIITSFGYRVKTTRS